MRNSPFGFRSGALAMTEASYSRRRPLFSRGELVLHPWTDEPTPVPEFLETELISKEGPCLQRFVVVAGFMDIASHFAKVDEVSCGSQK